MSRRDHLRPPVYAVRLTLPAREALMSAAAPWHNEIDRPPQAAGIPIVTLRTPPRGLVISLALSERQYVTGRQYVTAVRCHDEPRWPAEIEAYWWTVGEWVPCATCGAALLWCEAGYVPGWRICLSGHASQLSEDGRSAKRHASQDASTLRSTRRI